MNRSSNDPAGEQATETVDVAILGAASPDSPWPSS